MQKEAAWLLDELNGLVEKGVLDAATAARLRAHYAQGPVPSRLGWGTILLAVGGAALIGLGIILLFAHNWANWTPEMRVVLSLLPLLIGQAACAVALRNGSRAWSEAGGAFAALAIGASIALIAQTYQFGGDLPRFLLSWLLIAAPLVYLLDSSAVAVGCWALALGWVVTSHQNVWWYGTPDLMTAMRLPVFLALFSVPLPHLIRHLRLDRASARAAWLLRAAIPVFAIGLGFAMPFDTAEMFVLTYSALAAVAALAGQGYFRGMQGLWGNPMQTLGHLGVFAIALSLTVKSVVREVHWPDSTLMLLPLAIALAGAWLAWRNVRDGDRLLSPLVAALPFVVYTLGLFSHSSPVAAMLVGHAYVLALAAALIRGGLREGRLQLANEGVTLGAALVLLRFFDSDLSYVVRGVGFIVTGVAFFAAIFWLRRQVRRSGA